MAWSISGQISETFVYMSGCLLNYFLILYRKHEGHVTLLYVKRVVLHVESAYEVSCVLSHEHNIIVSPIINVIVDELSQWAWSKHTLAVNMYQFS